MTPRHHIRHLELFRSSGVSVGRLSRALESRLPRERGERISVFPCWELPERTELLSALVARLNQHGFAAQFALGLGTRRADQVAADVDAQRRYLDEAASETVAWPATALVLTRGDGGAALASDPDGATLFIDLWGPGTDEVGDDVFDIVWAMTKEMR